FTAAQPRWDCRRGGRLGSCFTERGPYICGTGLSALSGIPHRHGWSILCGPAAPDRLSLGRRSDSLGRVGRGLDGNPGEFRAEQGGYVERLSTSHASSASRRGGSARIDSLTPPASQEGRHANLERCREFARAFSRRMSLTSLVVAYHRSR